jgi:type I restriction enzyme S subunit
MYGAIIGATSILDIEAATNQACGAFLPSDRCLPEYLYYFFLGNKSEIIKKGVGGAQPNISASILKALKIPLPNLETQKRIAAILDEADTLRQLNQQLIAKYDALTQSLFLDMFDDPISNPKGWEAIEIQKLILKVDKLNNGNRLETIRYVDISSIDNKTNQILNYTEYKFNERPSRAQQIIKKGDVLLSTVRPNLKNIALNNYDDLIASTGFFVFRVNQKINNWFLFELLKSESITDSFVKITSGANYPALNNSELKKLKFIVPPTHLQTQFAERVQLIEQQKQQTQDALQKREQLFNGLLQKAFNGTL